MQAASESILGALDADDRAALHALLLELSTTLPPLTR